MLRKILPIVFSIVMLLSACRSDEGFPNHNWVILLPSQKSTLMENPFRCIKAHTVGETLVPII